MGLLPAGVDFFGGGGDDSSVHFSSLLMKAPYSHSQESEREARLLSLPPPAPPAGVGAEVSEAVRFKLADQDGYSRDIDKNASSLRNKFRWEGGGRRGRGGRGVKINILTFTRPPPPVPPPPLRDLHGLRYLLAKEVGAQATSGRAVVKRVQVRDGSWEGGGKVLNRGEGRGGGGGRDCENAKAERCCAKPRGALPS